MMIKRMTLKNKYFTKKTEMMLVLLVLLGIAASSCIIGTLGYQPALPPLMTMTMTMTTKTKTTTTTRRSMIVLRDRRTTGNSHDADNDIVDYTMHDLQTIPTTTVTSRRSLLATMLTGTTTLMAVVAASPLPAQAVLDIESFLANDKETTPYQYRTKSSSSSSTGDGKTMSDDEALCRFGSPSKKVGEACVRAGMSTKRPSGVDAFGTVDRGDFVKCKPNYVDDPDQKGRLINIWDCK